MSSSEPNEKSPAIGKKPTNDANASERPLGALESSSVYDFLYHDARRIAAFLAQFETYGVLQGVKAHESVGRSSATKATANAGIDFANLARGGMAVDGTVTDDERDAAERTYDPLWRNATTLLDYLADRDLIIRNIGEARISQFVLVTGTLAAFDVGMLREAWKLPAIKKAISDAASQQGAPDPSQLNRHDRKRAGARSPSKGSPETEAALELIPLLPHSVQGTISDNASTTWFNLREESMIISSSELLLKHGIGIQGTWTALGILDALPQVDQFSMEQHAIEQLIAGASLGGMIGQMSQLAMMTRLMLGRPPGCFGITPLMIFRQVSS
ncbi:hypothetical protein HNR60_004638 [Rhodopseudomonas rhenobacensis]|uniref:Uncharacterized protein n=1 Tax=Rhodopseudomonas rhenobacensis TaxID=87461 RepID=A0A7W7Z8A4_9BRAD|nr:hypothetical protein [Rhodopseudomonas rhenobacensis]MBB5049854.1 hypothetical protein [Rhodopseudomonas rhenobacensis]